MKTVFISGIKGNMGQRYRLICQQLGLEVYGADMVSFTEQASFCRSRKVDGIIIATPTHTHVDAIQIFGNQCGRPMLVEKPLRLGRVKNMPDYNVTMVNQYKYLTNKDSIGLTYYNYFKTGGDGLLWDCINLVGLAKGEVQIKNTSPFWRCMINGHRLNIKNMDGAYFSMIKDWTENPVGNREYFEQAHDKVYEMVKKKKDKPKEVLKPKTEVIPILGRSND